MVEKKLANVENAHRLYNEFGGRSDGEEAEDFQAIIINYEPHHYLCLIMRGGRVMMGLIMSFIKHN